MGKKKWIYECDILRAVAIIFVMLSHLSVFVDYWFLKQELATTGLVTFFFVSGFLLAKTKKLSSAEKIKQFYKKRFLRIYPLYFVALAAIFAVFTLGIGFMLKTYDYSLLNFVVHSLSAQAFFFGVYDLPVMWFIGTIIIYYLIYPFIAFSNKWYTFVAAALVTLAAILYLYSLGMLDPRVLRYWPAFFLGIGIRRYSTGEKIISPVLLLLAFFITGLVTGFNTFVFDPKIIAIALASLAYIGLVKKKTVQRLESTPAIVTKISYSSYASYLLHIPIMGLVSAGLIYFGVLNVYSLVLISLPATLAIGFYVQKAYDSLQGRESPRKALR